jgi:formylglycine-generating enzyme required for sulfatase activity
MRELADSPSLTSFSVPFEWIPIPEGDFWFGKTGKAERVSLPSFAILKYEVTNEQWHQYLEEDEKRLRKRRMFTKAVPRHWGAEEGSGVPLPPAELWEKPVVFISWVQAQDFCKKWLARQPGCAGARLPTSAEWEKAARGPDDDRPFPWGKEFLVVDSISDFKVPRCNVRETGFLETVQVGKFYATDVSPYGVVGMGGNVAEFVGQAGSHWFRGGTFLTDKFDARVFEKTLVQIKDDFTWSYVGFRVARSLNQ